MSLALPADSPEWRDLHLTFTQGKLTQDCAQRQFHERLPNIPEHLLKTEADTKEALASQLSHQCYLEVLIHKHPQMECFKVLAKSHLSAFMRALFNFGVARRECRKAALKFAKVRHEPNRLIESRIWGKDLFPEDLTKEILDRAAQENRNLLDKWDARYDSSKRKSGYGGGYQQKKKKQKQGGQRFQPVQLVPTQAAAPVVPTAPIAPVQVVQPAPTYQQSPAFNPTYEGQQPHYQHYGGAGRGFPARGRGGNRGRGDRGGKKKGGQHRQQHQK